MAINVIDKVNSLSIKFHRMQGRIKRSCPGPRTSPPKLRRARAIMPGPPLVDWDWMSRPPTYLKVWIRHWYVVFQLAQFVRRGHFFFLELNFMDQRKNNPPPFVYAWQKRHILQGSREVAAKRCTKKCDARVVSVFCLLLLHVLVTTDVVLAFNDSITRLLTSLLITGKVTFSRHVTLCKFNLCYKWETIFLHFYFYCNATLWGLGKKSRAYFIYHWQSRSLFKTFSWSLTFSLESLHPQRLKYHLSFSWSHTFVPQPSASRDIQLKSLRIGLTFSSER